MKRIVIGLLAVVAVVAVGIVYLYSSLGTIIVNAVEKYGTEIVGAKVSLASADVSASDGTGSLKGLHVRNPQPFATDAAVRLGEVRVSIDIKSLGSNVIHVREVRIAQPQITYELSGSGSNIDAIQRNVDAYVKKMGGGASAAKPADDKAGPKLAIDRVLVQDGQIRVGAAALGGRTEPPPTHLDVVFDAASVGEPSLSTAGRDDRPLRAEPREQPIPLDPAGAEDDEPKRRRRRSAVGR